MGSGIGCSSNLPGYIHAYGFHGLHGRALAQATGMKLGNHDLHVVITGGDGDGYGIGIQHFIHSMRRNIDLTYVVMNTVISVSVRRVVSAGIVILPKVTAPALDSSDTSGRTRIEIRPLASTVGVYAMTGPRAADAAGRRSLPRAARWRWDTDYRSSKPDVPSAR